MCIYFILSTNVAIFKRILVSETLHISTGTEMFKHKVFLLVTTVVHKMSFQEKRETSNLSFQIHLLPYPELNSKLILLSILPMKTLKVPFSVKKKSEENYIFLW